jgi:uncharacterized membrane protein YjjB (DUF3815 family)
MAALVFMELAFGVGAGTQLGAMLLSLHSPATAVPNLVIPSAVVPMAVGIAALSFAGLFRVRRADIPVVVAACYASFYLSRAASLGFGTQTGALLGALGLGLLCNGYARVLHRPQLVPMLPAILLLVPGSVGLRSVTWLLQHETVKAVDAAFDMGLIALSLAVGGLLANVVLPPRRTL